MKLLESISNFKCAETNRILYICQHEYFYDTGYNVRKENDLVAYTSPSTTDRFNSSTSSKWRPRRRHWRFIVPLCRYMRDRWTDRNTRDSISLLLRTLSIGSADKLADRSIRRRGVAEWRAVRCVQRLSLHIDRGQPGGIAVANLTPIQHANTRVLGRSRSGHPSYPATSLT